MEQRKDTRAARLGRFATLKGLRLAAALALPALVGLVSTPHAAVPGTDIDTVLEVRSEIESGVGAVLGSGAGAQQTFEGQWLVDFEKREDGRIQLTLRYRNDKEGKGNSDGWNWNSSFPIDPAQLSGLTREQAMSASGTNARFQLKRDAGTIDCEGWFRAGSGSGHFRFIPNPAFAAELRRQGIGEPTDRQLFSLAVSDLGFAFMEELRAQGYERPNLEQLVRMAHHGVRMDYLRGLKALGYQVKTIEQLVRMRDHGVSLAFIQELRDNGITGLTAEELVRARDHGVSASFIKELKAEGYEVPPVEGLIRLRDHGVSVSFVKELREEGYRSLPLEQLVRMRDHGVTTGFIRDLKALGYANLPVEELVRMRDHGVTASFVRRVKDERGTSPTVEELIRIKNRGGSY